MNKNIKANLILFSLLGLVHQSTQAQTQPCTNGVSRTQQISFIPQLPSNHLPVNQGGYRATPTRYTTSNQTAATISNTFDLVIPGWTGSSGGILSNNTGSSSMLVDLDGVFFSQDNVNTMTFFQSLANVNPKGIGATISLNISYNNSGSGGNKSHLVIKYNDVEYAKITTSDGNSNAATITYSNNASGNRSSFNQTWTLFDWNIYLPSNIPNNGDFKIEFIPTGSSSNVSTDDFKITAASYYLEFQDALPIKLASFNGINVSSNINKLNWVTAKEVNNKGFVIERSNDGVKFTDHSFVQSADANGNSTSIIQYEYHDKEALAGNNYYRLRVLSIDGHEEFSNVIVVNNQLAVQYSLYPNPAQQYITIKGLREDATVMFIDNVGKIALASPVSSNDTTIDVNALPTGNYIIIIKNDHAILHTQKIQIIK